MLEISSYLRYLHHSAHCGKKGFFVLSIKVIVLLPIKVHYLKQNTVNVVLNVLYYWQHNRFTVMDILKRIFKNLTPFFPIGLMFQ